MTKNAVAYSGSEVAAKLIAAAEQIKASGKTGIKGYRSGASDIHKVNPYTIEVEEGFNLRTIRDEEEDESLYQFVIAKGVTALPPLVIRTGKKGELILVHGHRRLEAIKRAITEGGLDIPLIGVVTEPPGMNEQTRLASIFASNAGLRMHPLDEAKGIARAMSWNWSPERIQAETGKNPAQQDRLLKLLANPEQVNAYVADGRLSPAQATEIVKNSANTDEALKTIEAMVEVAAASNGGKGSKRLLPKHNKAAEATSGKKVLGTFLINAESQGQADKTAKNGTVVLEGRFEFTAEQYAALKKLGGIKA